MKFIKGLSISILVTLNITLTPTVFAGGAQNHDATVTGVTCPGFDDGTINDGLSCYSVTGWSKGNHELNCTVIVPDSAYDGEPIPLIAWANGWEQGNILGQCTTTGYLKGLKQWAKSDNDGFIVAAANAWSVQESDVLACVQWVFDNRVDNEGDIPFDGANIGLVGHSQGGGAVIKAGNGTNNGPEITAVLAMNPYGPSWVNSENQDGPVLILGGSNDTTTPPGSYQAVWDAISGQVNPGGINAVLDGGTHNSEAWNGTTGSLGTFSCDDAAMENFGAYQDIGAMWWQIQLNGANLLQGPLKALLDAAPWVQPTGYSNFPAP
jgi:dienelactone hydrolase